MRNKTRKTKETPDSPVMIDREALTSLAHELYQRRGGEQGHDVEDWLTAERILLAGQKRANSRRGSSNRRRLEDKF